MTPGDSAIRDAVHVAGHELDASVPAIEYGACLDVRRPMCPSDDDDPRAPREHPATIYLNDGKGRKIKIGPKARGRGGAYMFKTQGASGDGMQLGAPDIVPNRHVRVFEESPGVIRVTVADELQKVRTRERHVFQMRIHLKVLAAAFAEGNVEPRIKSVVDRHFREPDSRMRRRPILVGAPQMPLPDSAFAAPPTKREWGITTGSESPEVMTLDEFRSRGTHTTALVLKWDRHGRVTASDIVIQSLEEPARPAAFVRLAIIREIAAVLDCVPSSVISIDDHADLPRMDFDRAARSIIRAFERIPQALFPAVRRASWEGFLTDKRRFR